MDQSFAAMSIHRSFTAHQTGDSLRNNRVQAAGLAGRRGRENNAWLRNPDQVLNPLLGDEAVA